MTKADIPSVTFNACVIPEGQPTWANIVLTGGHPPFRAVWWIDGNIDTTDRQRSTRVSANQTRLGIFVTLRNGEHNFRIEVFGARGPAGTFSFDNSGIEPPCNSSGEAPAPS